MARKVQRKNLKKKQTNKLGVFAVIAAVLIIIISIHFQTDKLESKLKSLSEEEEYYTELIEDQEKRTLELEEKKRYVQTKAYVEEMAKKLGLVYPDEIIYKPKD